MKSYLPKPSSPALPATAGRPAPAPVPARAREEETEAPALDPVERAERLGHRLRPKEGTWGPDDVRMDAVADASAAPAPLASEMAGLAQGGPVEFGANPEAAGKEGVAAEAASPGGEGARMEDGRVVLAGGRAPNAFRRSRSLSELGSALGSELPFERYRLRADAGSVLVEGKLNPWVRVAKGTRTVLEVRDGDMYERPSDGEGWLWDASGGNPEVGDDLPSAAPDFSSLPAPGAGAGSSAGPDEESDSSSSAASAPKRRRRHKKEPPPPRERRPRKVKKEPDPAAVVAPAKGYKPRRTPGDVYPAQDQLPGYKRKNMSDRHTRDLVERDSGDRDRTPAASAMAFDQSLEEPRGLRASGISRNHNIADSAVARLTTEASQAPLPAAAQADMEHFLSTLAGAGSEYADEAVGSFRSAQQERAAGRTSRATAALHGSIDVASAGPGNLRFDDAEVNEEALHGADYELSHGRMTPRAAAAREAALSLAHHGAVSHEAAFRAAQPTIRTTTDSQGIRRGQYVSSSVSSSRDDHGREWGDMQDEDTFRPRPRHPSRDEQRGASEPRELPSRRDSRGKKPAEDDDSDG